MKRNIFYYAFALQIKTCTLTHEQKKQRVGHTY